MATQTKKHQLLFISITAALIIFNLMTQPLPPAPFNLTVQRFGQVSFLENQGLYAIVLALAFFPVFVLSFDKRVHYYTSWPYLWRGGLFTAAFFIFWDYFKTAYQVWGFNPRYYLGITFMGLPIEELLFFVVIPFCCVFIYKCLNHYVQKNIFKPLEQLTTTVIVIGCLLLTIFYWQKAYTATTCIITGAGFLYHSLFVDAPYRARMYFAMLVSLIPHALLDNALTGAFTSEPLVIYNPNEYMGIFAGALPVEDFIYGFLLFLLNITFLEYFENRQSTATNS